MPRAASYENLRSRQPISGASTSRVVDDADAQPPSTAVIVPGGDYYDADRNFKTDCPGEVNVYSNIAVGLLGHVVEEVSGTSFEEFCRQRIFTPLEMDQTSFRLADLDVDGVAMPYDGRDTFRQALIWYYDDYGDRSDLLGHDGDDPGTASLMFFDPETGDGALLVANGIWAQAEANALLGTLFAEAASPKWSPHRGAGR